MTNPNQPQIKHLDELCVIHADFDIWSGQTRLAPEDLKLGAGGEIPPEKLALLGSKKICDPVKLRGFHRLKTKARRTLEHYGLSFMNGWAVPADRLDTILKQLDGIGKEFDAVRQEFLRDYDNAVEEWCMDNPGYEHIIRAGAMPRDVVEKRIGFDYQVFMIKPVGEPTDATQQRLNRKLGGLSNDLFDEINAEANKFYDEKLKGQIEIKKGTSIHLKKLRDKVDGLSFLNSAFVPLVNLLDDTLRGYESQAQGHRIVAPFLYQVVAAVLIMCDRSKIEGYANGSVTVDDVAGNAGMDSLANIVSPVPGNDGSSSTPLATQPTDDAASPMDTAATPAPDEPATPPEVQTAPEAVEPAQEVDSMPDPVIEETSALPEANGQHSEDSQQAVTGDDLLADMDKFFEHLTDTSPALAAEVEAKPAQEPAKEVDDPEPATIQTATPATLAPVTPAPQAMPEPVTMMDEDEDWGGW
jgi:hypothetical protein